MGDLLSACPVIASELNAGNRIVLLVFPQIANFVELIDFGARSGDLQIIPIGLSLRPKRVAQYLSAASRISPSAIWLSPHTPLAARSWKIPLSIWLIKMLCWRSAKLGGARSEKFSWLFDERVSVDRSLPFTERERTAYSLFRAREGKMPLSPVTFRKPITHRAGAKIEFDLLIFPGAAADNRKWPLIGYSELLRHLPSDLRIAFCGLPADIGAIRRYLTATGPVVFLEVPLAQAISSITRSRMVLCMDSGPMFFAETLGVPAVAIFGASDPANVISPGGTTEAIYAKKWPCQPCGSPKCSQKSPYCISTLDPAMVADAVVSMLGRTTLVF